MPARTRRFTVALAAAATLLVGGCGTGSAGPEAGVTVADVWNDAAQLAGEQVTVSGSVQRVLSDRAFVIGGEGGSNPLLVIHEPEAVPPAAQPVRITGTVRQTLDFEQAGVVNDPALQAEIYETYGNDPYLQATSVTPLPA